MDVGPCYRPRFESLKGGTVGRRNGNLTRRGAWNVRSEANEADSIQWLACRTASVEVGGLDLILPWSF